MISAGRLSAALAVSLSLSLLFLSLAPVAAQEAEVTQDPAAAVVPVVKEEPETPDLLVVEGEEVFPLQPPDSATPAETFRSFLRFADAAYESIEAERGDEAEALFERAMDCIDFSELPPRTRAGTSVERSLMLKGILDRLPTSEFDPPNDPEVEGWIVPGTEIQITRVEEGVREGQFLFSAGTVERLPEDFERVADLPYVREDATPEFYAWYKKTPGLFDTPKWLLWTSDLPDWASRLFYGQTLWQWAGFFVCALLLLTAARWAVSWTSGETKRRIFGYSPVVPLVFLLSGLAFFFSFVVDRQLNLTGMPAMVARVFFEGFGYIALTWAAGALIMRLAAYMTKRDPDEEPHPNASLLRLVALVLSVIVGFAIIAFAAEQIGIPVTGILAGLGVGGLAFGLAAQPTLKNLLGGISLLLDRPVCAGDLCDYGDHGDERLGRVEEIGLRSTRIRNLDRTVTSIPNDNFCTTEITNLSRRDSILFQTTVGVRYETSPEVIREILAKIRVMLEDDERIGDNIRVRFAALADYSLDILVRCFVRTSNIEEFFQVQEELLLRIMDIVKESGTEIAFPSMVHYQAKDSGLPEPEETT